MKRTISSLALILFVCVSLLLLCDSANAAQKMVFGNMASPKSIMVKGFEWWGSEIEKRSQGKVKFDYYWGASLVKPYEQTSAVIKNIMQVGSLSSYNPDISPFPPILAFPMINTGPVEVTLKAADELFRTNPEIQKWLKENNLKYMYQGIYAYQYTWSKVPIKSIGDLKGMNFRTFGPFLALFKHLGCNLLTVPVPEIYSSLERGVVKATTLYLTLGIGFNLDEVTKYLITTDLGHLSLPIVMNLSAWNKLPDDVKKIIEEINTKEMIGKYSELDSVYRGKEMKVAKDAGMTFMELQTGDAKKIREISLEKVWYPYVEKLDKRGVDGTGVLKDYLKLIEKYR